MIIFIETRKNNTIIKIEIKVWRRANMDEKKFAIKETVSAEEVKMLRKKLGLTQRDFAGLLGCSKPTVERLEREGTVTKGPMALLMKLLDRDAEYIQTLKDTPCTLIDVDEMQKIVHIRNYVDNIQFRAFGIKEDPTIEDYNEFLESRCFPRTRDKMKLVLRDLGIPFYDPYLIIQKTEGRMAEDDFWIRIER